MPPVPITQTSASIDLQPRVPISTAIVGSPALAAETVVASITLTGDVSVLRSVIVRGFAAFTVGTSGTAVTLRLRKDTVAGTVIGTTGALTGGIAAAALVVENVVGVDAAPSNTGQVYVLTLQVTGGAAASTVSAVELDALVIQVATSPPREANLGFFGPFMRAWGAASPEARTALYMDTQAYTYGRETSATLYAQVYDLLGVRAPA